MKRKILGTLLAALMLSALVIPAAATDGVEARALKGGFFSIGKVDGVEVKAISSDPANAAESLMADVNNDGAFEEYTDNSDKLSVTLTAPAAGEYAVFLMKGTELPDADNVADKLIYVDQKTAGTALSFDVFPKDLPASGDPIELRLFITSSAAAMVTIPLYYAPPGTHNVQTYKLGDVDGNNRLTAYDASLILQYRVGSYSFVGNGEKAADVDQNGRITGHDASLILQHRVGSYTIPGWED